jgi:hypothetical protein
MLDRMNIVEEMREADRKLDRDVERIMSASPRCEIHGCHFVAGCGVAGEPTHVFGPGGGCPQCFWEQRNEQMRLQHYELSTGELAAQPSFSSQSKGEKACQS